MAEQLDFDAANVEIALEAAERLLRSGHSDAESIVAAALSKLAREGVVKPKVAEKAFAELGLKTDGNGAAHA